MRELLTPQEVAERLDVHKNTIYRWIKTGELNAYRLGGGDCGRLRIEEKEVRRFLSLAR